MQKIDIDLKPSRQFISLIGLVLVGSVVIITLLPLSTWFKSILIMGTLAYGIWILWFAGLMKSTRSIIGLQLLGEGSCKLHYPLHTVTAEIKRESTMTTVLCVLRFIVPGKRLRPSCVIFKDSLDQEEYRQLLVWLRCC